MYLVSGNKKIGTLEFFQVMTPVLHFTPYIPNITVQHEGRTLPISTDLKIILTNYITLKLFSYPILLHEILLHPMKRKE